jgi:hypothetical protein
MRSRFTAPFRHTALAVCIATACMAGALVASPLVVAAEIPATPVTTMVSYEQALAALEAQSQASAAAIAASYEAGRAALQAEIAAARSGGKQQYEQERAAIVGRADSDLAAAAQQYEVGMQAAGKKAAASSKVTQQWYSGALKSADTHFKQQQTQLDTAHAAAMDAINGEADNMIAALRMSYESAASRSKNTAALRKLEQQTAGMIANIEQTRAEQAAVVQSDYVAKRDELNGKRATERNQIETAYRSKIAALNMDLAREAGAQAETLEAARTAITQTQESALQALDANRSARIADAKSTFQQRLAALDADLQAQQAALEAEHAAALAALEASLAAEPTRLAWTIPTQRVNGAALAMSELAGYELYYSSADTAHSGVIPIASADQTVYDVAGLQPGTYMFAVSAVDAGGLKSDLSPVVEAVIN